MEIEQTDKGTICTVPVRTRFSHVQLEQQLKPALQTVLQEELQGASACIPVHFFVDPCNNGPEKKECTTSLHVVVLQMTSTTEQKIRGALERVQEQLAMA